MAVSIRFASRGLGEFLTVLEQRLAALPADELRVALVVHAERLSPGDREEFLAIFPVPSASVSHVPGPRAGGWPDGAGVLADIDAFIERVRSGVFFQGWGWDDDLYRERAWGDESWVDEMDDLFAAAADAFLAGDLALAQDAYGRLLGAFDLDQEVGTFCGPSSPSDMVATDVPEAVARFLRAVYETTTLAKRAGQLYDRYADLGHLARGISLHTIANTRRSGLPDLGAFLPAWIEVLTEHTNGSWARDRQRLLTEATVLHAGTDGLAAVARRPGDHQPIAYLDWVDALTGEGRLDDAANAAREAMTAAALPEECRAEIADRLGELAACLGDPPAALDARRTAWRAYRTRRRLLAMVAAADAAGQRTGTLDAEAASVPADADRLGCELLLLAGRTDTAIAALVAADPLGWSRADHPGPVVWPVLLAAAVAPAVPAAQTRLGRAVRRCGHRRPLVRLPQRRDGRRRSRGAAASVVLAGGPYRRRPGWFAAAPAMVGRGTRCRGPTRRRGGRQQAPRRLPARRRPRGHLCRGSGPCRRRDSRGSVRRRDPQPLSPARGLPGRTRPSDGRVAAVARTYTAAAVASVQPANRAKLDRRIAAAATAMLSERQVVTPVEVLVGIGWLSPADVEAWRRGRVPYLERVATANLAKLSTALRLLHDWARRNGLTPSETVYVAWTRDRHRLRFTRTGDVDLERAYRTHWVCPALAEAKHARQTGVRSQA